MLAHSAMTPKEELLAEFRTEYERIGARLRENRQLIEQSQLEVDRLRERNVAVGSQLRRVEGSFDTIPRADIKAAYDDALDAKTRLLTMQGQLEKLKGNQEELQKFEVLLGRLLSMVEGVAPERFSVPISPAADTTRRTETGSLSTQAIVRVVEAQEAERKRLARQMHDGPAQSLTNFILQAEICQRLFNRDPDRAGEELDHLKTAASSTFQKVRDFIFDLRPMMLDDLGLIPTMRRYIEAYQEKTNIQTQLNILGDERRLPGHIEVMIFRSIQEIMANARDNLSAKKVEIVLDVEPDWVKAIIESDGRAFDPEQALADESGENVLGLRTLKERVELVGGSFDVVSSEDGVSRFTIVLPGG
jgi:two-component system sensor histidine kinase DegS